MLDSSPKLPRPIHYLRTAAGTHTPTLFAFVAVQEARMPIPCNGRQVAAAFAGVYVAAQRRRGPGWSRSPVKFCPTQESFWAWLDGQAQAKKPLWVYGHNLGRQLALLDFFGELDRGKYRLIDPPKTASLDGRKTRQWRGLWVDEDPPTVLVVRIDESDPRTIVFADSRNYWPVSIEQLAADADCWLPPDYTSDTPEVLAADRVQAELHVVQYAVTDAVHAWVAGDCGPWKGTAAGLAWSAFRRKHLPPDKILIHDNATVCEWERHAYHGGRCSCMYVGHVVPPARWREAIDRPRGKRPIGHECGPVHVLDFESYYPSIMSELTVPVELVQWASTGSVQRLRDVDSGHGVLAEVRIHSDHWPYPVRLKDRLVHAVGDMVCWLAWPELQHAVQAGHVREVGRWAEYREEVIFASYVDWAWPMKLSARLAGRAGQYALSKVLLNSLYGKFAQRSDRWVTEPLQPISEYWGRWYEGSDAKGRPQHWRSIGPLAQRLSEGGESENSFPAIAAWITSAARVRLNQILASLPPRSVYYVDTDSLHVTTEGKELLESVGLIEPNILGLLRVDGSYEGARYYGTKHYSLDGVMTAAGLSAAATWKSEASYEQLESPRLASIVTQADRTLIVSEVRTKRLRLCHPDGVPDSDGWVSPPRLPDDAEAFGGPILDGCWLGQNK